MLLTDKHIFMMEDSAANAVIMTTALQTEGAIIHWDRWGQNLIERLKRFDKIDIILMDLMLPAGVTGYTVFDQIKAVPELADVPVVVVSASDANIELRKAQEHGFVGYIPKPINFLTFPKTIAAILDGEAVWADDFLY